jgi:hypothetical protein
MRSYHPTREQMFLIEPGDSLSFYAIPRSDWRMMEEAAEAGEWIAELVIADGVAA